jgi:hypothetical protein
MAGAGVPGVRCWCRAVPGGGAVVDPNAPGVGLETGDGEEYEEATRGQRGKERWKEAHVAIAHFTHFFYRCTAVRTSSNSSVPPEIARSHALDEYI